MLIAMPIKSSRSATRISRVQARRVLLAVQGLIGPAPPEPGTEGILAALRRMHSLQIDTISVVARSPYLVLWSRLGDYEPSLLDALLDRQAIFEYWSHAACFLSIEDYPFYRRMMIERQAGSDWRKDWAQANRPLIDGVLQRVRDCGPVRSVDFERTDGRKSGSWWDWKGEKIALEMLLTRGDLMVAGRRNFQRLYDLRERILPEWDDCQAPPAEIARRELLLRAVRALGLARPEWVKTYLQDIRPLSLAETRRGLAALADEARIDRVEVEGGTTPAYVHPDNFAMIEQQAGDLQTQSTTFLSPFDPVVWDRRRTLDLFGFDYKIECYTPAARRRYGYFTLPILHGDALVGRLDAKARRKEGIFEVKALHLEPGVAVSETLVAGLRDALARMAAWHKTPEVVVRQSDPAHLREALALGRGSGGPARRGLP